MRALFDSQICLLPSIEFDDTSNVLKNIALGFFVVKSFLEFDPGLRLVSISQMLR